MKKFQIHFLISLAVLFLVGASRVQATHVMGSDITYKCISAYKWEVTLNIYRDCRGIAFNLGSNELRIRCLDNSASSNLTATRISITDITPTDPRAAKRCSPQNQYGGGAGIEKHVYRTILDLNNASFSSFKSCNEIYIEFSQCCRNSAITTGANNANFYTYASIVLKESDCNTSPQYLIDPVAYLDVDAPQILAAGGVDHVDYDSLVYSFAHPLSAPTTNIAYLTGYSKDEPIDVYYPFGRSFPWNRPDANPPEGIFLDKDLGNLVFTPIQSSEVTVFVIQIDEYRKDSAGIPRRIGSVRRDLQLEISTFGINNPPTINIRRNGSSTGTLQNAYLEVCKEGNTNLCFDVETDDKPLPNKKADTVTLRALQLPPGAAFEILNPNDSLPKGRFCWTASDSFIRAWGFNKPYNIVFEAKDNHLPMNAISQKVVRVRFLPSNSVKSYVRGFVYDDEDANCTKNSADVPAPRTWVNYGKNIYTQTNDTGFYTTCLDTGKNHIRLDPSQWFKNCGDTVIHFKKDSVYNVNLFRTLEKGITGFVFSNAYCDTSVKTRLPLAGVKVIATPGNYVAATDAMGRYVLKVPSGTTYTVRLLKNQSFAVNGSCDTVYTVNVSKDSVYKFFNFAASSTRDLSIDQISRRGSCLRWGTDVEFKMRVNNFNPDSSGTIRVRVLYDSSLTNLRIPGGDYTIIRPGEFIYRQRINAWSMNDQSFTLHVDTSKTKISDKVFLHAFIDSFSAVANNSSHNDTVRYLYEIRASYDPNIKTTFNDSIFTPVNPWLDYNVTFQNTGNDVAYDVLVLDTLPSGLDYSTLEMKGATHAYTWSLDNNKLQVYFKGINLPDSASNPELSIGSFSFRIRINDTTRSVQHFANRAAIYFDINPPIYTPYHHNTFYSPTDIVSPQRDKYCLNEEIPLDFKGFYPIHHANHTYVLELSENGGSFANPRVLMVLNSKDALGTFSYILGDSISDGWYRFRVRGSYPEAIPFNGFETKLIELNASRADTLQLSSQQLCAGEVLQITSRTPFENKVLYVDGVKADSLGSFASWSIDTFMGVHFIHLTTSSSAHCFQSTDTLRVEIHPKPTVQVNTDTFLCFNKHVLEIQNQSSISGTYALNYALHAGDGRTFSKSAGFTDTMIQYGSSGLYRMSLIANTLQGCTDSTVWWLRIADNPEAIIGSLPDEICFSNTALNYSDQSNYPASGIGSRQWDFGDGTGSSLGSGSHTWNAGTYQVQLIASSVDGCSDTAIHPIIIYPLPAPQIGINEVTHCFSEQNLTLQDQSNLNGAVLATRSWNLGDGGAIRSEQSLSYQYASPGNYSIQLMLETAKGCKDSVSTSVQISVSPEAEILLSQGTWCSGEQPVEVQFTGNAPAGTQYNWNTGDGNVLNTADFNYTYSGPGLYTVNLVLQLGLCSDTASVSLEVLQGPEITVFEGTEVCEGQNTTLSWQINPLAENFDLDLDYGDGTNEAHNWPSNTSASKTYAAAGTYQAVLRASHSNGCVSDSTINIQVNPLPAPSFEHEVLGGGRIRFKASGNGSNLTRTWKFGTDKGDESQGDEVDFVYAENGTYTVQLIEYTLEGCEASLSKEIEVLFGDLFFIPNAFSPNNDGINDEFRISNASMIKELKITLWNQWGLKVYEGNNIGSPLSGFEAIPGQYVYVMTIRDLDGRKHHFKGVLSVLP